MHYCTTRGCFVLTRLTSFCLPPPSIRLPAAEASSDADRAILNKLFQATSGNFAENSEDKDRFAKIQRHPGEDLKNATAVPASLIEIAWVIHVQYPLELLRVIAKARALAILVMWNMTACG